MCALCANDRTRHTMIHTKQDYLNFIQIKKKDAMDEAMALGEANEILFRQQEVKKKLAMQAKQLGGSKIDWENVTVPKK